MDGIFTWRELSDRGLWDRYCEISGADPWRGSPAEGADADRQIIVSQSELIQLGILPQGFADAYQPEPKWPEFIHPAGCTCDLCYTDRCVSLTNATAEQMEAMLAGKIKNSTGLEFTTEYFRGNLIRIRSSEKYFLDRSITGEEDGFFMFSWDLLSSKRSSYTRERV